jgi:hypothetical protein
MDDNRVCWEYFVVLCDLRYSRLEKWLTDAGAQGWELIFVLPDPPIHGLPNPYVQYIFKRKTIGPAPEYEAR